MCGVLWFRKSYPNDATASENIASNTLTVRVALSDMIYSSDTSITVNIASGFYTQGGHSNNAASSFSVTNNSAQSYPTTKWVWATVPFQRVTGDFVVESTGDSKFAQNGQPVAAVIYGCADAHSHTASVTVTQMTISNQNSGDQHPVLVYAATIPISVSRRATSLPATSPFIRGLEM